MAAQRDKYGRFLKGHSGGPGRPKKGESFGEVLATKISDEELAERLAELIREGDMTALKYAIDRRHGKPIETVDQHITEMPSFVGFEIYDDTEDSEADSER